MNTIVTSLKAVSEPIRVRILLLLAEREACVCELMQVFDMAQSKISHHLITLRDAGLLQDDKRRKWNYYRVNMKALSPANRELALSLARWLLEDGTVARDRRSLDEVKERMGICC